MNFGRGEGHFLFALFCALVLFLVVMLMEGLHWLTGGVIPRAIEWREPTTATRDVETGQPEEGATEEEAQRVFRYWEP